MKNIIFIVSFIFIVFNCAPPDPIIIEVPVEKKDKLTLGEVSYNIDKLVSDFTYQSLKY